MKQTIALCACLLAVNVAAKAGDLAQAFPPPPVHPRVVHLPPRVLLPPYEIAAIVRSIGLKPLDRPLLHGVIYGLHAVGPTGEEVRVAVDARSGRIVRIDPVRMPGYAVPVIPAPYGRPPGLIPMPDRPPAHLAEIPQGAPPPELRMPPGVAPAPRVHATPAPGSQAAPLPRPRPKVAAANKPPQGTAGASAQSAPAAPAAPAPTGAKPAETTAAVTPPPAPAEQHE